MLLLSIILPVYNMEAYLEKCLDSILRQGLAKDEYEVILVNDGSTDNSRAICEKYTNPPQSNFRLINQENAGVAAARNAGIDAARGKFVGFVDPDDYLLDDGLKIAFRKYAERDDIDVIHYYSSYDFWDTKPIVDKLEYVGTTHDLLVKHRGGLPSFCWIYIYRKDFLDRHNIRFKPYCVGEDQLFVSTVFIANARYLSCKADIYRYVVRESSASTDRRKAHARRCVNDYLSAYDDLMQALRDFGVDKKPEVYDACIRSVDSKKTFGFSRIMTAGYGYKDFKRIREWSRKIGFAPFRTNSVSKKARLICCIENATVSNFIIYKIVSGIFNRIITPYVMPRLRVSFKR